MMWLLLRHESLSLWPFPVTCTSRACSASLMAIQILLPPPPFLDLPKFIPPPLTLQPLMFLALPPQLPSFFASLNQLVSTLISRAALCSHASLQFACLVTQGASCSFCHVRVSSHPWALFPPWQCFAAASIQVQGPASLVMCTDQLQSKYTERLVLDC